MSRETGPKGQEGPVDMSEGTGASGVETRALLLAVRGLCVDRPDGSPLLVDVGLELRAREVVAAR